MMPLPFDSSPSVLWSLDVDGKIASSEVRLVPNGTEVRMLRNGKLLMSRIFAEAEEALAWAEVERKRLLGWMGRTGGETWPHRHSPVSRSRSRRCSCAVETCRGDSERN